MTEHPCDRQENVKPVARWAPWWIYLVVILGANVLRQMAFPYGKLTEVVNALIALGLAGTLFIVITIVYRAAVPPDTTDHC